jgi:pimeloyl-ACP methyl ester carboxylesterase
LAYLNWRGNRIFYLTASPNSGEDTATVLCIHGAGGNCRHWAHQLAVCDDWGYRIIAVDLPGHGHSAGEPLDSIDAYSSFVEELIQLLDLKRPILAGHSMGGAIAMELAARQPDILSGLILIGTLDQFAVAPWLLESLQSGVMPMSFIRLAYHKNADEKLLEQATREAEKVSAPTYLTDFLACQSFRLSATKELRHIPCLVLFGAGDRLTPVDRAKDLGRFFPGYQLAVVQEAGHMVMLEQKDKVNNIIKDFLQTSLEHSKE